jgi:signal transduction histidine kinase
VSPAQLDALAVVKAQQAISRELLPEQLVTRVVQVALENTGARRGALLLSSGDKLTVAALSGTTPEGSSERTGENALPWTLLSYVKRTREHVLLSDTSQPHPFSSDAWLTQGKARSALCLPLLRGEVLHGALYLENDLIPHAFTPARISLLGHLAEQAAISLENAWQHAELLRAEATLRQTHNELEQRLEEHAAKLKQAQAQPEQTPPAVRQPEAVATVLHDVSNVLTSAVIHLHTMREKLSTSRMGRLKQLTSVMEQQRESANGASSLDARGSQLMTYLLGLGDMLVSEHAQQRADMEELSKQLEHIRAVIQIQRAQAKNALLPEECDLAQLIEDALSIQMPALERHGISITRELRVLAKARLDKHRVLQILINLISNARNAMNGLPEPQRHLSVRLEAQGTMARIQVVDTGMGIAPEHRERLFTRGYTTRQDGQGLGLHSSALAAKTLGGSLTLESDGPGKGATATLELPLA